jgi:plastocyanin
VRCPVPSRTALLLLLCCVIAALTGYAETVDASVQVRLTRLGKPTGQPAGSAGVVVWLTPLSSSIVDSVAKPKPGRYRLVQKDKKFTPHLLVVPTGSSVDFPNLDPFFHNVFSQFNGKRFDLGLYETGSSRTVHLDHDGISYIFCNIHPEMSAVIVTLSTPYFDVSPADGSITLHAVPPGAYEMHVWAEGGSASDLNALSRRVVVSSSQKDLGVIDVTVDSHLPAHKNKFGEDYQDPNDSLY